MLVLVFISAAITFALQSIHLPGSLMFGPMISAMLFWKKERIRIPKFAHAVSQSMIGCLVARAITAAIFASFLVHWPLFLSVVSVTILAAVGLGWLFSRYKMLPGTTAIWGLLPGAATVMIIMSEEFGADVRFVAFIQYLRVVFVAMAASLVAFFALHVSAAPTHNTPWLAPINPIPFIVTMVIALVGALFGPKSKLPAGTLLLPMIIGALLQGTGMMKLELPQLVLALAYAVLGWSVGLKFTREVLAHTLQILPQTIVAILSMILFCGGMSLLLSKTLGIDPLTAYLSTSPGGMDSIAIIAASSKVDMSFVMGLQTIRFLLVLLIGPTASRFVATKLLKAVPLEAKQIPPEIVLQAKEHEGELD